MAFELLQGVDCVQRLTRLHRASAQIVADVLRVDRYLSINGFADFINAEILRLTVGVRLRQNQPAQRQAAVMLTGDGIDHFQFKRAVALLGHGAADSIPQHPNAVALQAGRAVIISRITNDLHLLQRPPSRCDFALANAAAPTNLCSSCPQSRKFRRSYIFI